MSDWSSDVCASELHRPLGTARLPGKGAAIVCVAVVVARRQRRQLRQPLAALVHLFDDHALDLHHSSSSKLGAKLSVPLGCSASAMATASAVETIEPSRSI